MLRQAARSGQVHVTAWLFLTMRALLHSVAPSLHSWAETTTRVNRAPLSWICTGCGAVSKELP